MNIQNQNEFTDKFISTLKLYKELTLASSAPYTENAMPKRIIIDRPFFSAFQAQLEKASSDITNLKFLNDSNEAEFRLLSLLKNLNDAKMKFLYYQTNPVTSYLKSPLHEVNDTIKMSFELTTYVYLLKWLQECFNFSYKKSFEDTAKIDLSLSISTLDDSIDTTAEFNSQLHRLLLQKDIYKVQEQCDRRSMHFLSSMLNGGLPLHDSVIDSQSNDIDVDLLPPYMKNKDLLRVKGEANDEVVGNANWVMWIATLFASVDNSSNSFDNIFRIISGNTNNVLLNSKETYEYLYVNIVNLFNVTLFETMMKNSKHSVNFHFSSDEEENMNRIIRTRQGKNFDSIAEMIRNSNEYQTIKNDNLLIDIQLSLIQMHFSCTNMDIFYKTMNAMLLSISQEINNVALYIPKFNDRAASLSDAENRRLVMQRIALCNYNKIIFEMIISLYETNHLLLKPNLNYKNELTSYYSIHDELVIKFIEKVLMISTDPMLTVYLTSFMFNFDNVKFALLCIAKAMQSSEGENSYEKFTKEVEIYYPKEQFDINEHIANSTDIFNDVYNNNKTIDDVVNEYIAMKKGKNAFPEISQNDKDKIIKILQLFDNKDDNSDIAINYLIKLLLRFISTHKFNEANALLTSSSKIQSIDYNIVVSETATNIEMSKLDSSSVVSYIDIDNEIAQLEYELEENDNDIMKTNLQKVTIKSLLLLIRIVLDVVFKYVDLICISKPSAKSFISNQIKRINLITKTIMFNDAILQFMNEKFLVGFFGDVEKIISDWTFQPSKWTVELCERGAIDEGSINVSDFVFNGVMNGDLKYANKYLLERNFEYSKKEIVYYKVLLKYHQEGVLDLVYRITKMNKMLIKEINDEDTYKELCEDIDEVDI